jgi:ABC-type sugar transport system ATPase subunit
MPDGRMETTSVLEADRISKPFGAIPVFFSVNMQIRSGEVHALIGENGAGKSTLMKILSGFHNPTSGNIRFQGAEISLHPNGEAEAMGIVLIHQELNLAEQMTVEENVFLDREISRTGFSNVKKCGHGSSAIWMKSAWILPHRAHFRPLHRRKTNGRDRQSHQPRCPCPYHG